MDVGAQESCDGVRMAWNTWPCTKTDASQIVLPLGCLYTPLKAVHDLQVVHCHPILCQGSGCGTALNKHCQVDFGAGSWTCPACELCNALPPQSAGQIAGAELVPRASTVEYILPAAVCGPPAFLLVLDLALHEEELQEAKLSIQQCLAQMPPTALVGLVTFGTACYVHEVAAGALRRATVFQGTGEYTAQQVAQQLGLCGSQRAGASSVGRFLAPVADCELALSSLLDDLPMDPWSVLTRPACRRPARCTGAALGVAVGLMETACSHRSCRVMLLTGGACSIGPGAVVAESDPWGATRSASQSARAAAFYGSLAKRAVGAGFSVDVFACSLEEEAGLREMKVFAERTGGYMVMATTVGSRIRDTLLRVLERGDDGLEPLGFDAELKVALSQDVACCGAIGCLSSMGEPGPCVSQTEIGCGGTSRWAVGFLDRSATVAFYFDVRQERRQASSTRGSFLQFQTAYTNPAGHRRVRVTSLVQRHAAADLDDILVGFDQEAAAVLMARVAVDKCRTEEPERVMRWLDERLIRFCARFADYEEGDPASFRVPPGAQLLPEFMYHLSRGRILRPYDARDTDESALLLTMLLRETVQHSLVMIQPALLRYRINEDAPEPVRPEDVAMQPDVILLLDTFFQVLIWHGEHVESWLGQGLHELEEHANLKALVEAPREKAKAILADRFPTPRYHWSHYRYRGYFVDLKHFVTAGATGNTKWEDGSPLIPLNASLKMFVERMIEHCTRPCGDRSATPCLP